MRLRGLPSGKRVFQKLCLSAFLSASVWFLLGLPSAQAEEPSPFEQRMLRMEEEIRMLKERNEQLEKELRGLRETLEAQPVSPSVEEGAPEAAAPSAKAGKTAPEFEVGYKDGFYIGSEDGQYKLKLGGRVTTRYSAFESDTPLNDQFAIKRARLETDVSLLDYYDLRVQLEFSDTGSAPGPFPPGNPTTGSSSSSLNTPRLKDAYIDVHYFPEARFRMGQYKAPFSWEALLSHKYLDFVDTSIAVNNTRFGGRDIGAMLHGKLLGNMLEYQLAVLNGSGENTGDNNSEKDLDARLVLRPFSKTDNWLVSGMQFGISETTGKENTNMSGFKFSTTGGLAFNTFSSGDVMTNRTRLGTEFIWPFGPASIKSEWIWMWMDDFQLRDSTNQVLQEEDLHFRAWYLSGTYLLTGEKKALGRIVPSRPFDPFKGTWGAWEIAARYSAFKSDDDLIKDGFATGTDGAEAFTIGLNWYLNPYMRVILDYEHTDFDHEFTVSGDTVDDEDVIIAQWQMEF
jgi:phosphate-selective porin OprO/OprP